MDFHPKQTHVRMITQESGCTRTQMIPWYTREKHWSDVRPTRKYCVEFLDYFLEALESNAPWPRLEILLEDYTIKLRRHKPRVESRNAPVSDMYINLDNIQIPLNKLMRWCCTCPQPCRVDNILMKRTHPMKLRDAFHPKCPIHDFICCWVGWIYRPLTYLYYDDKPLWWELEMEGSSIFDSFVPKELTDYYDSLWRRPERRECH